jgi:hypothetical protein
MLIFFMDRQNTSCNRKEIRLKNGHYYDTDSVPLWTSHFSSIIHLLFTFQEIMSQNIYDWVHPDDHYDTWRDNELTTHTPERDRH